MPDALSDVAKYTLLVVGALFPIVNPIGNTPIFLSLTRGLSGHGRAVLARMIALNGLILILTSIFIGTHILAFFGISLPVVQVGGGLVVISTGWTLLRQPDRDDAGGKGAGPECSEADYSRQAFYPLTLPLTVGPGSISVAITVGANRPEGSEWHWPLIAGMLLGAVLQAAALEAKAAAEGLTLEDWLGKLAATEAPASQARPRKGRYNLAELMAQCDPNAPMSAEDRVWLDAPAVGREAL
jgi:multiple antibiotic resistance protein